MDQIRLDDDAPVLPTDPFEQQVGGNHYLKMRIQPNEFFLANDIGALESAIISYVARYKDKGGVEDLKKARHTLDQLIAFRQQEATGFTLGLQWEPKDIG